MESTPREEETSREDEVKRINGNLCKHGFNPRQMMGHLHTRTHYKGTVDLMLQTDNL